MTSEGMQTHQINSAHEKEVDSSAKNSQPRPGDYSDIKVLLYHRVVDDDVRLADTRWNVSRSQLSRHIVLLNKWGFTCVSFSDYVLHCEGKLALPKRPVILTFDDGYQDTYQHALPILKSHGVRATLFVLGDRSIRSNIWDEVSGAERAHLLETEQISELHESGFEIGSHSMTHTNLTKLSRKDAWNEISSSKSALEDLLHAPVISFAYPFGATSSELQQMVQDAGYRLGCGTYSGPPEFRDNIFNIRRIPLYRTTSLVDFAFKMLTPYRYYAWLRWKAAQSRFLSPFRPEEKRKTPVGRNSSMKSTRI